MPTLTPSQLAAQVRRLQITTRHAASDVFAGEYSSAFKGRGIEFADVREYLPGDDIRSIDWNVTARTGRPFIKRFREERELTVILAADMSASGAFGSVNRTKRDLAAEVCATLAFAALRKNDRIGLVAFTDRVELFLPPRKGPRHTLRLVRELLAFTPSHTGTNLAAATDHLSRVLKRRAVVFVVSDFLGTEFEEPLRRLGPRRTAGGRSSPRSPAAGTTQEHPLRRTTVSPAGSQVIPNEAGSHSNREAGSREGRGGRGGRGGHDVIVIDVTDPLELTFPRVRGLVELQDAETGSRFTLDASSPRALEQYRRAAERRRLNLQSTLRRIGADHLSVSSDRPYLLDLMRFFHARELRR